jgi:hypothetical protein
VILIRVLMKKGVGQEPVNKRTSGSDQGFGSHFWFREMVIASAKP